MAVNDWLDLMISKMYFGSLDELQGSPWAERPESHVTRDSENYETNFQWFFKQKKYEDRVLRKKIDDKSTILLETFDKTDK